MLRCGAAAGFLATVFDVFRANQVSVDVVATSEVSISLSLDPKKCWHDGEVGGHVHYMLLLCTKSAGGAGWAGFGGHGGGEGVQVVVGVS